MSGMPAGSSTHTHTLSTSVNRFSKLHICKLQSEKAPVWPHCARPTHPHTHTTDEKKNCRKCSKGPISSATSIDMDACRRRGGHKWGARGATYIEPSLQGCQPGIAFDTKFHKFDMTRSSWCSAFQRFMKWLAF